MDYNITYREKDKGIQVIISYKNKNGKWIQKSKQGFKKKSEAKRYADKMLEELKEDFNFKDNLNTEYEGITFEEFSKMYLEHSKLYQEYKTIKSTEDVLSKYSALNPLDISKITFLDIQRNVDMQTVEGLNPNTIKYYLKKLSIIFNSAKDDYKIIKEIPTKNIKVGKSVSSNKKALTENEVNALLKKLEGTKYYLIVFLAVNTGMRLGEILGLTWDCVDLKNNSITVNKQWKQLKNGEFGFGELKTENSKRVIPISKSVVTILQNINVFNIDNRVISIKNKNSVSSILNKIFKNLGYDITIHELRHTYATKLIANGLDFKTAAKILGHDIKQTMLTYSHVNSDMIDRARQLIENIF